MISRCILLFFRRFVMSKICELPNGLSYYPSANLKITGMPKMVLDISRSTISMIPENLKGVDCIVARRAQIEFISPDYLKDIVLLELNAEKKYSRTTMLDGERQFLFRCYQARKAKNSDYFKESSKSVSTSEFEKFLPQDLSFSWDFEKNSGILDARKTALTLRPSISGVDVVLMPSSVRSRILVNNDNNIR